MKTNKQKVKELQESVDRIRSVNLQLLKTQTFNSGVVELDYVVIK